MSLRSFRIIGPAFPHLASPFVVTTPPSGCAEATAFLTRATAAGGAPDSTHQSLYTDLICGLVTDGVWSSLDVLQVYATDTSAHAVLNLKSSSYTADFSGGGGATFTADRGFSLPTGSEIVNTAFNPTGAANFQQNAASLGIWCVICQAFANTLVSIGAGGSTDIYPQYSSGAYETRLNETSFYPGPTLSDGTGFSLANRSGTQRDSFRNGSSVKSGTAASIAVENGSVLISGIPLAQAAAFCAGGDLLAVQGALYTRLRTYMTAVGVP